jgi:hypothetical protein
MANEWTTLAIVKSAEYLNISVTTYDTNLTRLIQEVTAAMIDYLDNDDVSETAPPEVLKRACARQVTHDWQQREKLGVTSITYPDGTINRITADEWLPEVKAVLDRRMENAA